MMKVFDLQSDSFSLSGPVQRDVLLLTQLRDVCEIDVTSEKPAGPLRSCLLTSLVFSVVAFGKGDQGPSVSRLWQIGTYLNI